MNLEKIDFDAGEADGAAGGVRFGGFGAEREDPESAADGKRTGVILPGKTGRACASGTGVVHFPAARPSGLERPRAAQTRGRLKR